MDRANIEHDCYPKHMLRVKLTEQDFPTTFKPRRFDIRTPPTDQHLSTAECLAWVLSRIEDDDNRIYDAIMKPLDLMVRQWHSFSDRKTDAVDRRSNKKQKKRQQSALLQNDDVVAAAEENDGSSKRTRELGIADECSGES